MTTEKSKTTPAVRVNVLLTMLITLAIFSCASIPQLQVAYTRPSDSDLLKGRPVVLEIVDQRPSKAIVGRGAADDFEGFSNSVSLSVAAPGREGTRVGIFQVPSLMEAAFRRNLESKGARVLYEKSPGTPTLIIVLKAFSLDLAGREWVAEMRYEARLTSESGAVATQFINGKAERYKVIGRDGADTLMSEIFTDMVNSLDIGRLFRQAGL